LKGLYSEFCGVTSYTTIYCDSRSAICQTKDQMFHERTKHIDVRYHFIRGVIVEGDIKVCKINTCDNPANMLTKPVLGAKFELCSGLASMGVFSLRKFLALVTVALRLYLSISVQSWLKRFVSWFSTKLYN
jgi:hypothetical protein